MNKKTRIMKRNIVMLCLLSLIFLSSCGVSPSKLKEAKEKGDALLEKIAEGNAFNEFPRDEFSKKSVNFILKELIENCGFNNENGVFVNDFIQNNRGTKYIHLIYEFPLDCGNKRIMIMYLVDFRDLKLVGFGIEPAENKNVMVLKPERQLKNRNKNY